MSNLDVIKKEVNNLPSERKQQHGFFNVDVLEDSVHFYGNNGINWWNNTVKPIIEKAEQLGLDVKKVYGHLVIREKKWYDQ